jgi:hypothetical protein
MPSLSAIPWHRDVRGKQILLSNGALTNLQLRLENYSSESGDYPGGKKSPGHVTLGRDAVQLRGP